MQTHRSLRGPLAAMALSLLVAGPARADKVICDGNPICLVAMVPLALAGVAFSELNKPPEKRADAYIRDGKTDRLVHLLGMYPTLARDPVKGQALLLSAAAAGNLAATQALVYAGALANLDRSRALGVASSVEVMRYLIAHGALATEVDLALMQYNIPHPRLPELLGVLLDARGVPLDANDADAISLLDMAARSERADVVNLLLARGVNPNGDAMRTPLLTVVKACGGRAPACQDKALSIARDLIARGADVNVVDRYPKRSALQIATQMNYAALVQLLEDAGAAIERH